MTDKISKLLNNIQLNVRLVFAANYIKKNDGRLVNNFNEKSISELSELREAYLKIGQEKKAVYISRIIFLRLYEHGKTSSQDLLTWLENGKLPET